MRPASNQPARLIYVILLKHTFDKIKDITSANIKFRPIIDQTGFYTYDAAQVFSDYLRCLCKNASITSLIPNLSSNISQI